MSWFSSALKKVAPFAGMIPGFKLVDALIERKPITWGLIAQSGFDIATTFSGVAFLKSASLAKDLKTAEDVKKGYDQVKQAQSFVSDIKKGSFLNAITDVAGAGLKLDKKQSDMLADAGKFATYAQDAQQVANGNLNPILSLAEKDKSVAKAFNTAEEAAKAKLGVTLGQAV